MAAIRMIVATLALAALVNHGAATAVTPVQKVLTMMTEMKTKGEKMMEEESKTYSDYSEWVSDQSRSLGFKIKTANSDIEKLMGAIAKADSDVNKLGSSISKVQ